MLPSRRRSRRRLRIRRAGRPMENRWHSYPRSEGQPADVADLDDRNGRGACSRRGDDRDGVFEFAALVARWKIAGIHIRDQKANRRMSRIWMIAMDGGHAPVAETIETASSNSPRWSPDGKSLAFISEIRRPTGGCRGSG